MGGGGGGGSILCCSLKGLGGTTIWHSLERPARLIRPGNQHTELRFFSALNQKTFWRGIETIKENLQHQQVTKGKLINHRRKHRSLWYNTK